MKIFNYLITILITTSCAYSVSDKTSHSKKLEFLPKIVTFSNGQGFEKSFSVKTFSTDYDCESDTFQHYLKEMCRFYEAIHDKKLEYKGHLKITVDLGPKNFLKKVWLVLNLFTLGLIPHMQTYYYNFTYTNEKKSEVFQFEITEYRSSLLVPFFLLTGILYDHEMEVIQSLFLETPNPNS